MIGKVFEIFTILRGEEITTYIDIDYLLTLIHNGMGALLNICTYITSRDDLE